MNDASELVKNAAVSPGNPRQPVKILVVDDEPDLEFLIKGKFRRKIRDGEYEFLFARNGVEALSILRSKRDIDMLLSDINMPEMDGLTLLLQISKLDSLIKAVIISAYGDLENIRTAMNRGAFDFLTKPLDFEDLEITITKTIEEVRRLRASLNDKDKLRRLENEIQIARDVQESILPSHFPQRDDVQIYGRMIPAKMIGGDFYDYFFLDGDRIGFMVGDVSGKGVPAAFFMAISRTLFNTTAALGMPPHDCLREVNRVLSLENERCMFVTAFYGILHLKTGILEYSDAGHEPPILVKKNGTAAQLEPHGGIVLGIEYEAAYDSGKVQLEDGDTLFLFTDGFTEATGPWGGMYTTDKLLEFVGALEFNGPEDLVDKAFSEIEQYSNLANPSDDITALAVSYNAKSAV